MHMNSLFLSASLATLLGSPVLAQDTPMPDPDGSMIDDPPGEVTGVDMTPEQKAHSDAWSAEQRALFSAWPVATRTYYWTLVPYRQSLFWRISDPDKVRLTQMTPDEQAASWEALERSAAALEAAQARPGDPETPMPR